MFLNYVHIYLHVHIIRMYAVQEGYIPPYTAPARHNRTKKQKPRVGSDSYLIMEQLMPYVLCWINQGVSNADWCAIQCALCSAALVLDVAVLKVSWFPWATCVWCDTHVCSLPYMCIQYYICIAYAGIYTYLYIYMNSHVYTYTYTYIYIYISTYIL